MPITQWDPAIARAKEQLPNVDLTLTMTDISQGGWAGYSDNIVTLIAGGEQLDVIMIAIEGLGLLTGKKILAPLDDFLASDTAAKDSAGEGRTQDAAHDAAGGRQTDGVSLLLEQHGHVLQHQDL